MSNSRIIWTSGTLLFAFISIVSLQPYYDDYSDLRGPYCSTIGCCTDRRDTCSQPIIGTLCYCDEFCNRTDVHDCCPDYWSFCFGLNITTTPPPTTTRRPIIDYIKTCSYKGVDFFPNQTTKDNCNECRCVPTGITNLEMMCETNVCLIDPDIVDAVNDEPGHGWRASNYSKFWGRTLEEGIRYRLGTLQPQKDVTRMNPVKRYYDPNALPREFDSAREWPRYITGIQDQQWCGSSWAISTAAVASDRYGIISRGKEEVQLSAQNIISCLPKTLGCEGGRLDRAWTFVRKYGVVDEPCFPYTGLNTTCSIRRVGTLRATGCTPPKYSQRTGRYTVGPAYRLGNETDIMFEIMRSGPVQATIKVYHDFFSYDGGVYSHTDLSLAHQQGYHSVRIVGWGEEFTARGPQKYWKVANSWGADWGENGYFRIVRGSNECEIENFVLAVWSEVDRRILLSSAYNII